MATLNLNRWYPHPPERVWRVLTEADLLARWLMPNDFQPRVGHRFTFRTDPAPGFDGVVHCEVLELEPPVRLAFTWKGGPIDTVVRITLAAEGDGTRLRMEQSGFRGIKAWLVSRILKSGLPTLYGKRLPAVLDEIGGGDRPSGRPGGETPEGCMTPSQGIIRRILGWLQGDRS